ncbi:MAG: ABC transporter permease [Gammaproteobacteria bacterium]|nr:ABC transporter permease [Gammaproteobacteria bacterium]MBU1556962.1 ABC transporter permease [Gammaproteobacteria bacterium]MBU2069716.1 ABC transporter permease [Gammaproteobacteria bacterium]MBU2184581.1 ABC transporter permease [Gammaproteobacteria bacterium]MBU2205263.1 ABC transporter permease [Gammaproteobacteria bacterium]
MSAITSAPLRAPWKSRLLQRQYFIYYMFILVLAAFSIFLHDTGFFSLANFMNIVRQTAPITVMAVGLSFALAVGHIDLSIGAVVALSAIVAALLLQYTSVPLAVAGALLSGVLVGLVNGVLIERLRVSSLLVTLGTMGVITGLARQISGLESIPIIAPLFLMLFGAGEFLSVPGLLCWTLLFALLGYLVMNKLVFGRHLLAVGGNAEAARAMGINISKVRIQALVLCSVCAAIAGLLYAGRLAGARYTLGEADLLTVIAAVAIGGASLFGGRVSIIGAVIGSWLMGMINNGLILSGFSTDEQMITRGVILISAVAIGAREARHG